MAGSRARWQGTGEDLATRLAPVAGPLGRSWVVYEEAPRAQKTKVDVQLITKNHPILAVLHECHARLLFSRSVLDTAVRALYMQFSEDPGWRLKQQDEANYFSTITTRLMNICRIVSQNEQKHPRTPWVRDLPWNTVQGSAEASSVADVGGEETFLYGWDPSVFAAWKCPASNKRRRTMSVEIRVPDGAQGTDAVVAIFADASEWQVSDLTVDEYRASVDSTKKAKDPKELIWSGVHVVSKNSLKITPRTDRDPQGLLSLVEQKRQVLQIAVSKCPDLATAKAVIVEVAQKYEQNLIEREMLSLERDRLMAQFVQPTSKLRKTKGTKKEKEEESPEKQDKAEDEAKDEITMQSPPSSSESWF